MARPIVATIDTQALRRNLGIVRQKAPDSCVWSVVKANAYGHGIKRIWQNLSTSDGFALLNLEDAILLRESGWTKPILLLEGFFSADELALLSQYRLTTTVHSNWQVRALAQANLPAPLDVYLKVNSGMNRLGFAPEQAHTIWNTLRTLKTVGGITLMSHFAQAQNPNGVEEPMKRMRQVADDLKTPCAQSLANSSAILWHPETHCEWVRPGIMLYGISPTGRWEDIADTGLIPVMSLQSQLIAVQSLRAGEGVGYGFCYRTLHKQRVGVVACGYGDGYPRHAPSGTPIYVDNVRTITLGMVSMDMLMVDLTPCPEADVGSVVELWGKNIKVDDVAEAAGTVGYELVCGILPRVPVITE